MNYFCLFGLFEQHFEGALAVDHIVVFACDAAGTNDVGALGRGDGPYLAEGEKNLGPLHDAGGTLLVEEGDQGFARLEVLDGLVGLEGGIGTEGLGGHTYGLLVPWGISTQGMLHTVAQLAEDAVGDIGGTLGDEIDAHALGTDEADDLLDFVDQGLGGVVEEGVRLVEEEDELGKVHVAHLGQGAVEFGEEPQKEGAVELRLHHQAVGSQYIHNAFAPFGLHKVEDVETGLAKEAVGPLTLELQEGTLDGTDGGRGDVAVTGGILFGMLGHVVEHRAQVLDVEDKEASFIGNAEYDVEHAVLGFVEAHEAREELRTHLAHGGADGVALLAKDIEETHGAALELGVGDAEGVFAFLDKRTHLASLADAREVALHIGHKAGYAGLAEGLGHHLQGDGLTGARGSGDKPMTVGHTATNRKRTIIAVRYIQSVFCSIHNMELVSRRLAVLLTRSPVDSI